MTFKARQKERMQDQQSDTPSNQPFETLERLEVRDLIASWQSDFGIDVRRLFEGVETLSMLHDAETGQIRFDPPVEGDASFYQALRGFDWYHPATKQEFLSAAKLCRPGMAITDVGAGAAGFAKVVPDEAYLGLETDAEAAEAARASGLNVLNMTMADYRASEAFRPADLVSAFQVLEHVQSPERFMADMVSLAYPGGRIAIGVPDAESYVSDLPDFMLNAPPHHVSWWTENAVTRLMEEAGLSVQSVHRFPVEPWEQQLWWMAKLARFGRGRKRPRFGRRLRPRKVASYVGSYVLKAVSVPKRAQGSTLLVIGQI